MADEAIWLVNDDPATQQGVMFRLPSSKMWTYEPRTDITLHELALILPSLIPGNVWYLDQSPHWPQLQRHFKEFR